VVVEALLDRRAAERHQVTETGAEVVHERPPVPSLPVMPLSIIVQPCVQLGEQDSDVERLKNCPFPRPPQDSGSAFEIGFSLCVANIVHSPPDRNY
jgi:hypothetical protein